MARGAASRAVRGNDAEDAFARLQGRLRPAAALDDMAGGPDGTVFVIPSIDLDEAVLNRHARELAALEERSLYVLFALRRPDVRLVVVTSRPVRAEVLEYYLRLIPEADDARARVELLSPDDDSPRPLARKILEQAELLARLAKLVPEQESRMPVSRDEEKVRGERQTEKRDQKDPIRQFVAVAGYLRFQPDRGWCLFSRSIPVWRDRLGG